VLFGRLTSKIKVLGGQAAFQGAGGELVRSWVAARLPNPKGHLVFRSLRRPGGLVPCARQMVEAARYPPHTACYEL
jgi:hypothetical protein